MSELKKIAEKNSFEPSDEQTLEHLFFEIVFILRQKVKVKRKEKQWQTEFLNMCLNNKTN